MQKRIRFAAPGRMLVASFLTLAMVSTTACGSGDTTSAPTSAPSGTLSNDAVASTQDAPASRTVQQAVTDPNGPNYVAVGGSFFDLVGEDGEPDELVGRLVNGGTGLTAGSTNENGWLVLGPTGKSIFLDEDGRPLGEQRDVIMNQPVGFAALGKRRANTGDLQTAWLVGGGQGRIQLVNLDGEPEENIRGQASVSEQLISGAYGAGSEQWLVGSETGNLFVFNSMFTQVANDKTFEGAPISAIVGNPDEMAMTNPWFVAAGSQIAYYPNPAPIDLGAGVNVTAAAAAVGNLIIGTDDGRVALWEYDSIDGAPSFQQVFDGQRVNAFFHNGTNWLALGDGGQARLVGDDGTPMGDAVTIGDGTPLRTARWAKDRWLIGTESSFVIEAQADLSLQLEYPEPLGGAEVMAADPGDEVVAVVGVDGKYAIVTDRGEDVSGVKTTAAGGDLFTASYNGNTFFIGGAGGAGYQIDAAGEVVGDAYSVIEGRDIHTASWNGNFWLVAGNEGYIERVRPDGSSVGQPQQLDGFDVIYHARWSGSEWMVVGEGDGRGVLQLIGSDGMTLSDRVSLAGVDALYAVEWSGREWLVGGTEGRVQFVGSDGMPRNQPAGQPKDVLSGATIYAIDFHDNQFLVGGERGLVRIVQTDLLSPRPATAVAGFETVRTVRWSRPRGFGRGECLTNETCYVGACLGGGQRDGFCCDRSCDNPCESCFSDDTGQPDGVCSPIPAGEEPVETSGCAAEDASTCGETGFCDGAGACALYGADVECAAASCDSSGATPARLCDGMGTCGDAETTSCEPFAGCDGEVCATSCSEDGDCIDGMMCDGGMCVEMMEVEGPMEPEPETDPEGCCAVVKPRQVPAHLPLAMLLGFLLLRRRGRDD